MKRIIKNSKRILIETIEPKDIICCEDDRNKFVYYRIDESKYYIVLGVTDICSSSYETIEELHDTWGSTGIYIANDFKEALEWLMT